MVSFATALKTLVSSIYGFPYTLCYIAVGKNTIPAEDPRPIVDSDLPVPLTESQLTYVNSAISRTINRPYTIGRILQIVGQAFRDVDEDYWIKCLQKYMVPEVCYIIDDVRYPNEAQWIKDSKGLVGLVISMVPPAIADEGRLQSHESEVSLDDFKDWNFVLHSGDRLMADIALSLRSVNDCRD